MRNPGIFLKSFASEVQQNLVFGGSGRKTIGVRKAMTGFELSGFRRSLFPGIEHRQRQQFYAIHNPGSFCGALNFGNSVVDLAPIHLQAVEHARHTKNKAARRRPV